MSASSVVVLSPHPDDAALSCGGWIHRQGAAGRPVTLLTLFCGDAPSRPSALAERLHRAWRAPADAVAVRRAEDRRAAAHLRAAASAWELPEAIYRRIPETDEPIYTRLEELFRPPHPADEALISELERRFQELPPTARLVAPLAAGGHVDHVLARRAAERARGTELLYYEDYPYAARAGALESATGGGAGWETRVIPLDRTDRAAKRAAVAAYRSQIVPLFGGRWRMRWALHRWHRRTGGERLWWRTGGSAA